MQTKLTLRLDHQAIRAAKQYVKQNQQSLSKIVADYFFALENTNSSKEHYSPLVLSLKGVLRKSKSSRTDFHKYLEKKYL